MPARGRGVLRSASQGPSAERCPAAREPARAPVPPPPTTAAPQVPAHFGTPGERPLARITLAQARHYYQDGEFPAGSMGPKMMAAIEFIQAHPQNRVIITDVDNLVEAVEGKAGTQIVAY